MPPTDLPPRAVSGPQYQLYSIWAVLLATFLGSPLAGGVVMAVNCQRLAQPGVAQYILLISGVLTRYPEIQFVSVESGIGWIPFALEALDYQFQDCYSEVKAQRPDLELLPSEYFARNVYACYWFEQTAPQRLIDKVGADRILFETDFPHPTSIYGDDVHRRIESGLGNCEASVRRKILWENAEKLYQVEPPTAEDEARLAQAPAAAP